MSDASKAKQLFDDKHADDLVSPTEYHGILKLLAKHAFRHYHTKEMALIPDFNLYTNGELVTMIHTATINSYILIPQGFYPRRMIDFYSSFQGLQLTALKQGMLTHSMVNFLIQEFNNIPPMPIREEYRFFFNPLFPSMRIEYIDDCLIMKLPNSKSAPIVSSDNDKPILLLDESW